MTISVPKRGCAAKASEMGIALILSGGAVRGAAHIGVIRRLEDLGLSSEVTFVAGTSAGALVGALYAAGYDSTKLSETFKESATTYNLFDVDVVGLLAGIFTKSRIQGLLKGKRIEKCLARYLGSKTFSDLGRRLAVIATNIDTGMGRIFTRGPLVPALRASMAIPGIYTPVVIDGETYVDGGVTDYVPLRALDSFCGYATTTAYKQMRCRDSAGFDSVIAVNLGYAGQRTRKAQGAIDYILQSVDVQGASLSRLILEKYPYAKAIYPKVYDVGGFDTSKIEYCIRAGYRAAVHQFG